MRIVLSFLSILVCLLWSRLELSTALVTPQKSASQPFQGSRRVHSDERKLLTRLRDGIVDSIWRIDPIILSHTSHSRSIPLISKPPSNLLARFGGDVVLRFAIQSAEEAQALSNAANILFLDVWEFTPKWVDVRLAKDLVPSLLGLLPDSLQSSHTPLMHDLTQTIYESYPSTVNPKISESSRPDHRSFSPFLSTSPEETNIFFQQYQPLSVILPWMRLLQSLFPTHVRLIKVGISYEGRDITGLRVGVHPTNSEVPSGPRKSIIITGGLHAREWISTSSVNYVAYSLITSYGKSKDTTKLLERFDWIFIPTLNPDGYIYSWEHDRLWRKTRQETNLRFCQGVDLDRTFGYQWDGGASINNPCSESFSGDSPFQGVESLSFANWVKNETTDNNVEFIGFLDFHSYSQQVLYPYSYSCQSIPPSLENLEELGLGLAKAIHRADGESYTVSSACGSSVFGQRKSKTQRGMWPMIETGGGSALDWFYHAMKVKYAYQIKLRDTGTYGFLLPSKNIVPTGKEAYNAVIYFGKYLLGNKGIETSGVISEQEVKFLNPLSGQHSTTTIPEVKGFSHKGNERGALGGDDNEWNTDL